MAELDESKRDLLENKPVSKAVLTMALPTVVATIVTIVYNLSDSFFVGFLGDATQTAAITISGNVTLLYIAVENIFGIGGGSALGRAMGKGEDDQARAVTAFCIWGAIAVALLFSVVYTVFSEAILTGIGRGASVAPAQSFLFFACTLGAVPSILTVVISYLVRTEGYATHAVLGPSLGCIVNVALGPFLITPAFLGWGVWGAGLATLIGNVISCLYMLGFLYTHRDKLLISFDLRKVVSLRGVVPEVLKVGVPAALQNVLNVVGMVVLNSSVSEYGPTAIAAIGIAFSVYMVPNNVAVALNQAAMPVISYNFGKKHMKRVKEAIRFTLRLSVGIMLAFAVLEFLCAGNIMHAFISVEETEALGTIYLRQLSFGIPLLAIDFFGVAVLQSIGSGTATLVLAVVRKCALEIPLTLLVAAVAGFQFFGLPAPIAELVCAIISMVMVKRALARADIE